MADDEILRLTDWAHARLRTEMYLGSRSPHTQHTLIWDQESNQYQYRELTWVPAVWTAFREILDNALDEVVAHSQGNTVWVEYDANTGVMSIEDNGRGIPIDRHPEYGVPTAQMVLSEARTGRNFGDRGEQGGANGVGASIVNFCSNWFRVTIRRDGKEYQQCFEEGEDVLVCHIPQIVRKKAHTGTRVEWLLSSQVFPDRTLPEEFVYTRVREIAVANWGTKVYWNKKLIDVDAKTINNLFTDLPSITLDIRTGDLKARWFLIPNWNSENIEHSLVNNIPAINGGSHMDVFRKEFPRALLAGLERESKRRKLTPNRNDVLDGLLIFNITRMTNSRFDSQAKTRLVSEEIVQPIASRVTDPRWIQKIIQDNPWWIDIIYDKCQSRTHARDQQEIKRQSKKVAKRKVANLQDATGKDRNKCILFLAEGKSAISGMSDARDHNIHGGLPLRGKVLNVNETPASKVLANQVLQDVMAAIGLSIAEPAQLASLRYGKVYIATDADEDGKNIAALLINFFYTYWPELFQLPEPYFYVFNTPLIIAKKGKQRKYWYTDNYHEFDSKQWSGWNITRAKGLGTLMCEDWQHSLANPNLTAIKDEGSLKSSLDLIFNPGRSDDRKQWIAGS